MSYAAVRRIVSSRSGPRARGAHIAAWPRVTRAFASCIRRDLRAEGGGTLVEFALTSIILFTLIFGVIAVCLALYSYNVTAEAAREATRYAIVRGSACSSGTFPDCNVTSPQLQTYVRNLGFPGINPQALTVAATWPTTGPNCTPSVSPCNNPTNLVRVTVTYTFPLVIPFVPSRTLNMTSTSQMVISQ